MYRICKASLYFVLFTAGKIYAAEAEYLGGTVKSIPSNIVGKLDLSSADDLIFTCAKGVYRLPFDHIKDVQWEHAKGSARHVLGRVQVPKLPWGKQDQLLRLSYRGDGNALGVLSFKVTGKDFAAAEWALKCHTQAASDAVATAGGRSKLAESWWGDRYWRTNRNTAAWPSTESEAAGTK